MPPPLHREKTGAAAARLGLAALLLVAGVILALGPGSAALAERVARAAEAASPVPTPRGPGPPEARSAVGVSRGQERVPPLRMPLAGPIVRGFEASAGTYGPGHRGVDVGGRVGEAVRAPAGGRVEFAGPVAGVTWVSLLVAPGVTVTVGPLLDAQVAAGQRVRALAPVGRLGPGHGPALGPGHGPALGPGHQPAHVPAYGMALHLGLRVDGVYVDPLPYLLDRPRPRLAPLLRPGGLAGPAPGRPTTG
jgi:murein DD-endopeptidase MepM/ murein hydrolase activator NlpD